jgi:hypothetical protein
MAASWRSIELKAVSENIERKQSSKMIWRRREGVAVKWLKAKKVSAQSENDMANENRKP